ncbi:hypothetical protein QNA08_02760 [Chelatococcus sp. SYSU_G07232]|uniref:YARHG domain-containing protein n=1 Tax=Chelatococcus albus TaxID=3047466 RepID=A0ABT7ACS5_9HYPH|nr:hypothetical protein [Chelatococcus sp. SYSU_G07232]
MFSLVLAGAMAASAAAFAGAAPPPASAAPAGLPKDYSSLSNEQIRTQILDACVVRQWGETESKTDNYAQRCGCYATRVAKAMTPDEFDAFRSTGYFSDSARAKAEDALLACKVSRGG